MSKEFEEKVLKKLDKVDDTEKLLKDVVLKKLDKVDDTEKLLKDVVLKKLDVLDERTLKTDETVQEISIELKDTQKEVKELNDKFTLFDYEINTKIDTLFDAFTVNSEKDSVHEKDINSLDEKVFNHDIRISNLEDKVLIA